MNVRALGQRLTQWLLMGFDCVTRVDLLRQPFKAEVLIHIMDNFERRCYVTKPELPQHEIAKVVESVTRSGIDLGVQHGIQLQLNVPAVFVDPQGQLHPEVKEMNTPLGIKIVFAPQIQQGGQG